MFKTTATLWRFVKHNGAWCVEAPPLAHGDTGNRILVRKGKGTTTVKVGARLHGNVYAIDDGKIAPFVGDAVDMAYEDMCASICGY